MENRSSGPQVLERLAAVARRRTWLGVAVFALAATAGVTVALSLPDVYRGTASVLVEQGRTDVAAPGDVESRLQLISQEILSRARLEAVIRQFGLYPRLVQGSSPQAAVGQMRRDIRTEFKGGIAGTIFFTVSYRSTDPQQAARVTNALASFYIEGDRQIRERQTSGTVQLLKTQLEELKQSLQEQEAARAEFQVKHARDLPQQESANIADLQGLHAELRTTSEERMRLLDRRNDLLKQLAELGTGETPAGAPASGPAAIRLAKAREELASLTKRYSDKYPDVVRLREEVAALATEAAQAPAEPAAPVTASGASSRVAARLRDALGEAEEEIKARKDDEARLRAEIAEHIRRLANAPLQQQTYQELSRDYQTRRDLYDSLRKRYEQAQLEEGDARPASPFRILDQAVVPTVADAPNRQVLALVALIAALAAAGAAMALAERMDASFHAADDVRAFTRVPVLASIPVIFTAADRRAWRWRFGLGAVSLLLALAVVVPVSHRLARNKVGVVAMLARP